MPSDKKLLTLAEIATLTNATLVGDPTLLITGVETLEKASATEASFLENPRYERLMHSSQAGVIFIPRKTTPLPGKNFLLVDNPSLAFQKVIDFFLSIPPSGFTSIHPTAIIHPEAIIGAHVTLGPYVVVDRGTTIGDYTTLAAHVSIGAEVHIGSHCHFHSHVVIEAGTQIGNRVIIQAGAVIGSSGFGYATTGEGKHIALSQVGSVVIEEDVEIGANSTIDRARFKTTRIGSGTKIDNLVQIAHQVELGKDNLIVSQVGIAGSTKTGNNVVIGGQAGIIGHIEICSNVMLAARSTPIKSITEPGIYSGMPAAPIREFNEQAVHLKNIKKLVKRVEMIEKKDANISKKQPLL